MIKFYKLTTSQRIERLYREGYLSQSDFDFLQNGSILTSQTGSHLIENYIGNFSLPLGIADHFMIDQQDYLIPMVTEEPSVIAAACNAAQIISHCGGFQTQVQRVGIRGQIVFQGRLLTNGKQFLQQQYSQLKEIADQTHPTLKQHGGGLKNITVQKYDDFVEFDLLIDSAEAMGANIVNTILEAEAHYLQQQLPELQLLMAILSNHNSQQLAQSQVKIKVSELATEQMYGLQVAQRIVAASHFAEISIARAATHNKGIMNGIIAVALATGNDTRNLSAAIYSFVNEQHSLLTNWQLQGQKLIGTIKVPLPLGSVGGAISTLPSAQLALRILRQPNAVQLMGIIASVGLASNLAALRALVTTGIQSGHMNLQWQSLALMAGAQAQEITPLVAYLNKYPQKANLAAVKLKLKQLRKEHKNHGWN